MITKQKFLSDLHKTNHKNVLYSTLIISQLFLQIIFALTQTLNLKMQSKLQ